MKHFTWRELFELIPKTEMDDEIIIEMVDEDDNLKHYKASMMTVINERLVDVQPYSRAITVFTKHECIEE